MEKGKSIIYVSYAPYENQGKILDYILRYFKNVIHFSIGHHSLGNKKRVNQLTIYKEMRIIKKTNLFYLPASKSLVFLALPLYSVINFAQILLLIFGLYKKYGKIDIYFSVNGYAAWMGLILKRLGLVYKTSYWICDYYPIQHENKIIQTLRWIYWKFETLASKSDILSFHNKRLVNIWRGNNLNPHKYNLVPLGTPRGKFYLRQNVNYIRLVFLGVVKKSQGLDYIFDAAWDLQRIFPRLEFRILGPGPDMDYYKKRVKETGLKTLFYGYINEGRIDEILKESTIGIATYTPDSSSVSFYGDPGKIKRYISLGLPVIATNIHEFSEKLQKFKSGVLVEYGNVEQLIQAIKKINTNYLKMSKNAIKLNNIYYYENLYPKLFNFSRKNY